jgi:hypothetical protein
MTTYTLATDGPLLVALERAKAMVAATAQWAAISNASKIHFDALPAPASGPTFSKSDLMALRPFCLLWHDVSSGMSLDVASADRVCPHASGKIICQFEIGVPESIAGDNAQIGLWVQRIAGRLARTGESESPGLFDLAATPGYLPIRSIHIDAYERTDPKEATELGDAVCFELHLVWGYR